MAQAGAPLWHDPVNAPNMQAVPFGLAVRHAWFADAEEFIAVKAHCINRGNAGI